MTRFDTSGIAIPTTWEELKVIQPQLSTYSGATRTQEDQEYYDLYQRVIPRELMLHLIKEQLGGKDVALTKNTFPYTRIMGKLPSVKHYLVWSVIGPVDEEKIKLLVEERFPGKEWLSFETTINNKSVPEIWHIHVLVNDTQ